LKKLIITILFPLLLVVAIGFYFFLKQFSNVLNASSKYFTTSTLFGIEESHIIIVAIISIFYIRHIAPLIFKD